MSNRPPTVIYPYRAGHDPSVAAFAARWLPEHALSERSRGTYSRVIMKRILPELGSEPLAAVTAADARALLRQLEAAGCSGPVVQQVRVVGSSLWASALEDGLVQ